MKVDVALISKLYKIPSRNGSVIDMTQKTEIWACGMHTFHKADFAALLGPLSRGAIFPPAMRPEGEHWGSRKRALKVLRYAGSQPRRIEVVALDQKQRFVHKNITTKESRKEKEKYGNCCTAVGARSKRR